MELRQLQEFLVLAEELHYARAAARLGMEQSPLSRHIKEFEQGLGVALFARNSRGTHLTPRGELLLPWARSIVGAADRARTLLRTPQLPQDVIRIAVCEDAASRKLYPTLERIQREGRSTCAFFVERPAQQAQELQDEFIDVGVSLQAPKGAGLCASPIGTDRACIVLPRTHPLAGSALIELREMTTPCVAIIEGATTEPTVSAQLKALALQINQDSSIIRTQNLKILLTQVIGHSCVGLVTPGQAELIPESEFSVARVDHAQAQLTTYLSHRVGEARPSVKAFIQGVIASWRKLPAVSDESRDRVR